LGTQARHFQVYPDQIRRSVRYSIRHAFVTLANRPA
jgi:hypothetical protein